MRFVLSAAHKLALLSFTATALADAPPPRSDAPATTTESRLPKDPDLAPAPTFKDDSPPAPPESTERSYAPPAQRPSGPPAEPRRNAPPARRPDPGPNIPETSNERTQGHEDSTRQAAPPAIP